MTEEQYCYHQIRRIKEEYERIVKPYVNRLVAIKSLEARPQILVNVDDLTPELRERLTR